MTPSAPGRRVEVRPPLAQDVVPVARIMSGPARHRESLATGFAMTSAIVVTAYHCLQDPSDGDRFSVAFGDGVSRNATFIGGDSKSDLGILLLGRHLPGHRFPWFTLPRGARATGWHAVGFPVDFEPEASILSGATEGVGRVRVGGGRFLQLSCQYQAANRALFGFSGSPVVSINKEGFELQGMLSRGQTTRRGGTGLVLAVPWEVLTHGVEKHCGVTIKELLAPEGQRLRADVVQQLVAIFGQIDTFRRLYRRQASAKLADEVKRDVWITLLLDERSWEDDGKGPPRRLPMYRPDATRPFPIE